MEELYTPPGAEDSGIRTSDTNDIIRKYIDYKGLVSDHTDSFNDIVDHDLNDVFERTYRSTERTIVYTYKKGKNDDISTVKIEPRYTNIVVHPPQMTKRETGTKIPLMPAYARLNNRYYVAPFTGDFYCKLTATKFDGTEIVREDTVRDVEITSLPIPERSNRCPLSEMSFEVQMNTGEDPLNPGGFFQLINEWIVNHIENLKYNELRAFNNKHDGVASRAEMLSKLDNTNGNSANFFIKIMDTGEITIVIDHKPFRNFSFPFYTIFKILGAETQKDIVDSIVYGEYESTISKYIQSRLTNAFNVKYKQFPQAHQHLSMNDLRHYIISFMGTEFNKAGKDVFEKNKNVWYNDLYKYIDRYFMPHIGQAETDRIAKYKALGFYIRYLYMVHMDVYEQTDRDSELSKRNERSGTRMVKMLKTYINSTIARPLLDAYEHALKHMPFEDIDIREIHNNACDSDRLKKIHIRLITGGSKKVIKTGGRGKPITNRLHTQQRTGGHLNTIATLRQIVSNPTTASSKQSEREHKMRQVHPSSFGYKCPVQTQESENVGLTKEMAITCTITSNSSISLLLSTLAEEKKSGLIIEDPSGLQIINSGLTRVTINWSGIVVGWTATPYLLTDKYRHLRRTGKIDKMITIHWDVAHDMVVFYCDGDRVTRPMVIVYNNYGDSYTSQFCKNKKDLSDFKQWIGLRKNHMTLLRMGKISITDLIDRGLIEYITAEEQSELLIAHSPDHLVNNENNHMFRYTHVEMPAALYGLPALVGVNANLNPGTRNSFHTNHCRQAAGEYAWNWRDRKDKGIGLQTFNELSPMYTIANKMTISAGVVCRIDIICDRYNQEDSQSFNLATVESGKFMIEAFDKISCSLGNDEEFRLPTLTNSTRKIHANYATISAATGMPEKDTILHKGDVVIAKVHKQVNKATGETKYIDRSIIYTNMEPGIVLKTMEFRNEDDVPIREVQIIKSRNPVLGDKFSSRAGQKGVLGVKYAPNDMYFDEYGGCADIIINPHCLSGDTRITMADGTVEYIENIYDKDYEIMTVDPITLNTSITRYTNGFVKDTTVMVEVITSSDRQIKCTPEHMLLIRRNDTLQWVEARHIQYDDRLIEHDRFGFTDVYVERVSIIEPELVYDFTTVSPNHSFIANGIVSHNCIPTRMTISQMTESVLSMIHALRCSTVDATIHSSIDVNTLPKMLMDMGLHPDGTSQLYNPMTGVAMKTRTFRGLVYYQNLQKFTQDKRYAIESGPTDIITRQPLEGKSVDGGLRIGEMERDVLLAIGATMFIAEKYYYHSNPATIYVCENCGTIPTVNTKYGVSCLMCRDNARAYAVDTTWSSWVFIKEIRTLNFKVRLELADHIYRR